MINEGDRSERVREIVRAVLQNNLVTYDDNLFEAGGDSLMLISICTYLEDEFHVEVPIEAVWEAPTIRDIAIVVEGLVRREVQEG